MTSDRLGTPGKEQLKGSMLRSHVIWLREYLSPANPAAADLGPLWLQVAGETRDLLEGAIMAGAWYDFRHLVNLDRGITALVGGDRIKVLNELGSYSAGKNVPENAITGRVHDFFAFSARLHHQYVNFGTSEYTPGADGTSGIMTFSGYEECHAIDFCASAVGYFRRMIQRFGHTNAEVRETSCVCRGGRECVYAMRWR